MNKLIIAILVSVQVQAQSPWKPTVNDALIGSVQVFRGAVDGIREEVLYHPNNLFDRHPNLNRQYWDSRISWHNKKDTWVAFSDANHTLRAVTQTADLVAISLVLFERRDYKKKDLWKVAVRKAIVGYLARKAGFALTYNLHFKNK